MDHPRGDIARIDGRVDRWPAMHLHLTVVAMLGSMTGLAAPLGEFDCAPGRV